MDLQNGNSKSSKRTIIFLSIFILILLFIGYNVSSNEEYNSTTNSFSSSSNYDSFSTTSDTSSDNNNSYESDATGSDNSSKTAGELYGKDWLAMSSYEKESISQGVIDSWENSGATVDVDADWFIDALDSFYGDDSTNNNSVAEAMSLCGVGGSVLHNSSATYPDNSSKTAGELYGKDWLAMSSYEKESITQGVIDSWENSGATVDVDADWFIDALDSFYGDDSTNNNSVAEAMSLCGVGGSVLHN